MHKIHAVFFDLWGTLIVDDPVSSNARDVRRVDSAHAALADIGFTYDRADIVAAFLAATLEHERIHAAGLDVSARGRTVLYLRQIDESLPDRVSDEGWRRLDEVVLTQLLHHRPSPMPGALQILKDVKSLGLPVGLISNAGTTPGFVLREMLAGFGLLDCFDAMVFSDEVELAKPSSAIFRLALDEFGLEPPEAAFVGDQPVLDVYGSRNAGLWTVQIGDLPPDGAEPHARIMTLAGVVPSLTSLGLVTAID